MSFWQQHGFLLIWKERNMYELTIPLNGTEPLYEQIYAYIRNQIKEKRLFAGTRLPSTRKLA